jgi:hypothetical protein
MFTRQSLFVSFALLLALACTGVVATSARTALPAHPQQRAAMPFPHGISAISSIARGNNNLLSFLDVQRYLTTRGFIGGPTLTGQAPVIQDLRLTDVIHLDTLLHFLLPEQPGNEEVYYAHLDGPFIVLPDLPLPILSTLIPSLGNLPALIPHLGNLSWLNLFPLSNGALVTGLPLPQLPPSIRMPDLSHQQARSRTGSNWARAQSKSAVLDSVYEIFDARSGNLLAWG